MTRYKAPKHIRDIRQEVKARLVKFSNQSANNVRKILSKSGKAVVVIATVLGIATGYLSLIPRLSVSQNELMNPIEPFSAPFIVSNDGPLPIHSIEFDCIIFKVESAEQDVKYFGPSRVIASDNSADYMAPGERATIPCLFPLRFAKPISFGDMAISVYFRPDFVPWHQERLLRFVTIESADGKLHWYPQPMPNNFEMPESIRKR